MSKQENPFSKYIAGTKAFDNAYAAGERCPSNKAGARCRCTTPTAKICRIWHRVAELAREIGGKTKEMVEGME